MSPSPKKHIIDKPNPFPQPSRALQFNIETENRLPLWWPWTSCEGVGGKGGGFGKREYATEESYTLS